MKEKINELFERLSDEEKDEVLKIIASPCAYRQHIEQCQELQPVHQETYL